MRDVRIWLNHWFSTAYHIIELIRRDDALNFHVIGSSQDENSVYRAVCDEFYAEPAYEGDARYAAFCLDFCREHGIEVFLPRRGMLAMAERAREFGELGVKLLAERGVETLKTLNDKARAYSRFGELGIGIVPQYKTVKTAEEFEEAYRELKMDGNRVCFKFTRDEGAASFRVVDDSILDEGGIWRSFNTKITYRDAMTLLRNAGRFPDLLLMPYLSGTEVSADCLRTARGSIVIPRFKLAGRSERIMFDDGIISTCERIMREFGLECPFNAQFKFDGGVPYLLEVNTRLSGGVQMSCLALNVNIPNIAVNQLLGTDKDWSFEKRSAVISYVETPVELK
ncbi:MAG: ATP-grasp domain-containing protein [Synergistaceae bacterium]|jgi:biotin carboxylase|nr:ATP-grasp domain-containing protein [Synergistaceae bacterium]